MRKKIIHHSLLLFDYNLAFSFRMSWLYLKYFSVFICQMRNVYFDIVTPTSDFILVDIWMVLSLTWLSFFCYFALLKIPSNYSYVNYRLYILTAALPTRNIVFLYAKNDNSESLGCSHCRWIWHVCRCCGKN